ncbi:MAG: ribosome maturation factor [Chitinophagaceae bacterium]|nr:ribosome maturation factor [Chitinophagaceae bacterium]
MDPITQILEEKIRLLIADDPSLFLVEIRIKPTNNIKIFIDGDEGVSIDKLVRYNRALYRQLEESGMFPGDDFSLEVSSPGLDEPLKLHRQYVKNTGRFVEVTDLEGLKTEGKMIRADETAIVVEEQKGKGKKLEIIEHLIPFERIKTVKIQIKF